MKETDDKFDDRLRSLMENAEEKVPKRVWSEVSKRLVAEGLQEAKPVVIPLWARWSAVGAAVAAALILGVFLFMRNDEPLAENGLIAEVVENEIPIRDIESINGILQGDDVAQTENIDNEGVNAVSKNNVGASIADVTGVLGSNGIADAGDISVFETGDSEVGVHDSDDRSDNEFRVMETGSVLASDEVSGSGGGVEDSSSDNSLAAQIADASNYVADAAEVSRPWTDPFDGNGDNRTPNKIRTAVTVSGDAFGNAGTSSGTSSGVRRQMAQKIEDEPIQGISESSDSNYGIPATFGVGVKIMFTPRWSLGVGVNYSMLSRTFSGVYTSYSPVADTYSSANYSNIRHRVDYIGIPVNAYFSIVQSHAVDFYAYAGGTVEKAVSNRYILDHDIPSYKESVKGVQCSADIGIGVEFIVVDWLGIYIDPSLRYYFPNSHQPKSIRTQESLNFGFEIGLRFRL